MLDRITADLALVLKSLALCLETGSTIPDVLILGERQAKTPEVRELFRELLQEPHSTSGLVTIMRLHCEIVPRELLLLTESAAKSQTLAAAWSQIADLMLEEILQQHGPEWHDGFGGMRDLYFFFRHFYLLYKYRPDLYEVVDALAESTTHLGIKNTLARAKAFIHEGRPMYLGFAESPRILSSEHADLLKAAEESGTILNAIDEITRDLAEAFNYKPQRFGFAKPEQDPEGEIRFNKYVFFRRVIDELREGRDLEESFGIILQETDDPQILSIFVQALEYKTKKEAFWTAVSKFSGSFFSQLELNLIKNSELSRDAIKAMESLVEVLRMEFQFEFIVENLQPRRPQLHVIK